jgi:hypothetical protein
MSIYNQLVDNFN